MAVLTFDEKAHIYRWNGDIVPNVTRLLDSMGTFAGVPESVLAAARKRGTAVHLACQFDDEGTLDEEALAEDEELWGYLSGWREFTRWFKPEWEYIEKQLFHTTLGYAGTPDRFGIGGNGEARDYWVIDIKSSAQLHPVWGVQTAAYADLIRCNYTHHRAGFDGTKSPRRGTVQLRTNGTYLFHEWTGRADLPVFLSLVTIHHWGKKHA